jgi:mono/diheme cytochrome c family protein
MLVAVALVTLVAAGCGGSVRDLYGEELYEHSCAVCHDLDGSGGIGFDIGPGSNTDLNLTDEQIAGVITIGPGNMPGFRQFTPEQVASLVEYVRSLSG